MKKIAVVASNNGPHFLKSGESLFSRCEMPYLRELHSFLLKHAFPQEEASEADLVINALRWTHNQWEHDGLNEPPRSYRALEVLNDVYEKQQRFRCVEYGLVLSEILQAFGFITRRVAIFSNDVAYGTTGQGHAATEVWVNQLGKWIFLDGQFGAYVTSPEDDVPLSYHEIFLARAAGQWESLRFRLVNPNECGSTQYRDFLAGYFGHMAVSAGGASLRIALSLENAEKPVTFQGAPASVTIFTDDAKIVYPEMNRVTVLLRFRTECPNFQELFRTLKIATDEDYLARMPEFAAEPRFSVSLVTSTPWFLHYEYRTGQKEEWTKLAQSEFNWDALEPKNRLEVRAINALDRAGPATWIDLTYG